MSHPVHTLAVWAPAAGHVDAEVGGNRVALHRDDDGWWAAPEVALVGPYRFVVDGDPIPDPRSCRQPEGVDGASWPLAPSTWNDGGWIGRPLVDEVIYELHVGTFTAQGTLDGAVAHLDELVDLGVTAVEVMPLATAPGTRGWGYDGVLLYAVHEAYGGPDAFRRFEADEAAQRAWVQHVNEVADGTLFPLADSWYYSKPATGGRRMFMPYVGGFARYRQKCEDVVASGYSGFVLGE